MRIDIPSALLREMVEQRTEKVVLGKDLSRPYIGLEHLASNSPDLLGSARADTSVSTNSIFERDDILFGKLRPNLKKCVLAPFPGYCSTDIIVLRARGAMVPGFAAKVLQSEWVFDQAVKTAVGTKMPRTSWAALTELRVFCPSSTEQRRIAVILDTLDDAIRRTEQVITKSQQMKQGLLHDLLTRGVDENGDLRPSPTEAPRFYKDSSLGRIPKEWEAFRLPRVCTYQNGAPFPSDQYSGAGIALLRPGNLQSEDFVVWDNAHTRYLPIGWERLAREFLVGPGEVVMNLTAQSLEDGFLGRVCVTPPQSYCLLNQRIARFRIFGCEPMFFFWACKSQPFRAQIDRLCQGTKVQHLYNKDLDGTSLGVPSNVAEQRSIAAILFAHSERIAHEAKHLAKILSLKDALLHDLLTGRVRVPVPAEVPA